MFTLFLLGNIASGKSTAARYLESRGALRIDLDELAKGLYVPGSDLVQDIASAFGWDVLDAEGGVRRHVLAARAFSTPEDTARLNALVHPALLRQLTHRLLPTECCTARVPAWPLAVVEVSAPAGFGPAMLFQGIYPLKYEEQIADSATRHGVDPYLVAAVVRTESGWDPQAVSNRGAEGLMQLMPETAQDMVALGLVDGAAYSASNLTDPATSIEFGCAYLSYLLRYFNGSTDRAIAAYNAGMGNVEDWAAQNTVLHNAITFPETQTYLIRVNNAHDRYRQLYPNAFA